MPKKLDPDALLKDLKKANPDDLRSLSARVSVRCMRGLMERCGREKLDLAAVVRQILEEEVAAGPGGRSALADLPEEAAPWLDVAIERVRQAYQHGVSPIDAILLQPLCRDSAEGEPYKGLLAPLISAAIESVPVQEILDYRTREMIESQKQLQQETYAQRLWRDAVSRTAVHVRPLAESLKQLELQFRARVKMAWRPDDSDAHPPVTWWFDDFVMEEINRDRTKDPAIECVLRLIRGGYLKKEAERPSTFRWEEE